MESFYNKYKGKSVNLDIDSDTFVDGGDEKTVGGILVYCYNEIKPVYLVDISTGISDIPICIKYTKHYSVAFYEGYESGEEISSSAKSSYLKSLEDYLNTGDVPFEDKLKAIIRDVHKRFNVLINTPFEG